MPALLAVKLHFKDYEVTLLLCYYVLASYAVA
jgi:hypothetical protein